MAPTVEGAKNIGVTALNFYEGALRGVGSGLAYVGWLPVVGLVARVPVHAAACVVEGYHSTTMRIASKSITDDPSIENIERCARKALTSKQRMALREIANME
jgi:hypothetical protein